ncbi:MAG: 50S ribosomal protein L11 methyltransferase, partial [Pseudomonadota bacterium]|nr:50S ribosomal protein L11 methyltransferase [Pseudomonadota bacterium]
MPWRQLTIETEALPPEELEAALEVIGALSVTAIDAGDEPIYEPDLGTTPFWSQVRLTALFPYEADEIETLLRLCAQLGVAKLPSHRFETLDDQVWERAWMDAYQP